MLGLVLGPGPKADSSGLTDVYTQDMYGRHPCRHQCTEESNSRRTKVCKSNKIEYL